MKKIEPDGSYTRTSKARILGGPSWFALPRRHPARIILQALQSGSAIALTGITLILVLGGLSLWRILDLVGLSGLDPAGLRAEAQAVDSQIELSNLNYAENAEPQSTAFAAPSLRTSRLAAPKKAGPAATGESTSTVDIDSALNILSE